MPANVYGITKTDKYLISSPSRSWCDGNVCSLSVRSHTYAFQCRSERSDIRFGLAIGGEINIIIGIWINWWCSSHSTPRFLNYWSVRAYSFTTEYYLCMLWNGFFLISYHFIWQLCLPGWLSTITDSCCA